MPCHAKRFLRYQSILHILSDGRLSHNDSSILLLKNFLEDHPMISSRRLFSALCVSQHTEPPFFLFFSAWLLPMFLPYFLFCHSEQGDAVDAAKDLLLIFCYLLFNISKRHSQFLQQFVCFFI